MIKIKNSVTREEIPFQVIEFPDQHRHFRFGESVGHLGSIQITIRLKTFDDLFLLKQVVDSARIISEDVKIYVTIVYLLASRFDRAMVWNDSFDLYIVADYINALKLNGVGILEPHSPISLALIRRSYAISPLDAQIKLELYNSRKDPESDFNTCFVIPDLGAVKRVEHLLEGSDPVNLVYANKTRILKTGEITGIEILNPAKLLPNVIVFDDLCDGGRTFTELAKAIRPLGVKHITLAVTHGVFSKGFGVLLTPNEEGSYVNKIITTNSYQDRTEEARNMPDVLKVVEVI